MSDYAAFEKEFLRKMAEAMGMTYEELSGQYAGRSTEEQMRFFYGGRRAGKTQAQREANMREINPPAAGQQQAASERGRDD